MNNIKLLKAQYKLNMSIIDKRGKVGIEKFVTALVERIAELEAAQHTGLQACGHHKDAIVSNGHTHWCAACESAKAAARDSRRVL